MITVTCDAHVAYDMHGEIYETACEEIATHHVVFEMAHGREEANLCTEHLDEQDVPGVMRHVRTTLLD